MRPPKDRLIGAVRLEHGSGGLVAVRRRGDQVVLSGLWPGGIMSRSEAARIADYLKTASLPEVAGDAPRLAAHWVPVAMCP